MFFYRHAELVSASYGIPKQVRDDGVSVRESGVGMRDDDSFGI